MDTALLSPAAATAHPRERRLARIAGALFLVTFVSAIAGAQLYGVALTDPRFVLGGASDTGPLLGALCELILIAANIGTALALYPVLRRRFPALSLGYVAARLVECGFIAVGILSVLTVVSLQRSGTDDSSVAVTAGAFVALHDWTFLLGPGFVVGLGNGLLLGWMMFRSRLVPRWMALCGVIGGPLVSLSGIAVLFGAYGQASPVSAVLTLPEIVWEASLGVWLLVKGFRAGAVPARMP
ncbi:DUF4386 domain-containing protein [Leifsonia sp. NPDC080035]|uniref:DUF4386 domain-containing protein n=1 Tax=Leifsonia sp. NPDC080035 TaxID=3143936 RepID=A0AAU7GAI6_9MICO